MKKYGYSPLSVFPLFSILDVVSMFKIRYFAFLVVIGFLCSSVLDFPFIFHLFLRGFECKQVLSLKGFEGCFV